MTIIVCPLSQVAAVAAARRPSHLISLLDPDHQIDTPEGLGAGRHLRLGLHDICDAAEGLIQPQAEHIAELVAFGRRWTGDAPILIHCWAGISRSTAAAFTLACERNPDVDEGLIARRLRQASAGAMPNRRIVALADEMLGREGRMSAAVEAIGYATPAYEGTPFEMDSRFAKNNLN